MKRAFPLVLLVALAGCKSKPVDEPMGDAAPAFGSTQELSTLEGFVVGRWKETFEAVGEMPQKGLLGSLSKDGTVVLTIAAGGKATLRNVGRAKCEAHGTWAASGNQLNFTFTDVDGKTPDQIAAELEKRKKVVDARRRVERMFDSSSNPNPPGGYGLEADRDDLWRVCERFEGLTVNRDGKTLIATRILNSGPAESAGPFSGTVLWLRLK